MKRTILAVLALMLAGCGQPGPQSGQEPASKTAAAPEKARSISQQPEPDAGDSTPPAAAEEKDEEEPAVSETAPEPAAIPVADTGGGPTMIRGVAIVNKKYGLSPDYAPGEDPEAVASLQQLIQAMQAAGLDVISSWSGYRSYEYQSQLYANYVQANGQAQADTFSARPGHSEHQTGLAFDLKHADGQLVTGAAEAQWLLDHAHEYGFIVRYQEGWEEVTGYMAEPWHLRYIGDQAREIREAGVPLETYLHAQGGDYNSGT